MGVNIHLNKITISSNSSGKHRYFLYNLHVKTMPTINCSNKLHNQIYKIPYQKVNLIKHLNIIDVNASIVCHLHFLRNNAIAETCQRVLKIAH